MLRPACRFGKFLWQRIDMKMVDGIPNGMAFITYGISKFTSALQTGLIYHYAIAMVLGLLVLLSWTILIL
jgi:NADH-quinone oxidoreductase subunit L